MSVVKVNVKWNKQQLEGIELDQSQPVSVFKSQLFSLTGVEPDRQKIMGKTGSVKDDTDWSTLKLKDGYQFMMMGTAGEVVADVKPTIKFIEDMTEAEIAKEVDFTPGLENLGNTCFANATIQCLGAVPELKDALIKHPGHPGQEANQSITAGMRDLLQQMGTSTSAVSPLLFILLLRRAFPQFDQQQNGMYMQQDAEECWTQIMNAFNQKLKVSENESFVKKFFEIQFDSTWTCDEDPEEPPRHTTDASTKMQCHISAEVNYLFQGLKEGLVEQIEKRSERLGRVALYTKSSKISHLPPYLTTNFIRFFWRKDTQKKAKILRKVKFPFELDVFEFCTDELKAQLQPVREILLSKDDDDFSKGKEKEEPNAMQVDNPAPLGLSGIYELIAVLTHIGRSSDSGHYMAWVKKGGDEWVRYDDDKATIVKEEEIMKLDGGGDWHTAYICLYRSKASKTQKVVKKAKITSSD